MINNADKQIAEYLTWLNFKFSGYNKLWIVFKF